YFGSAGGTARQNTCTGNTQYGIFVTSTAAPTLSDNQCTGNHGQQIHDQRNKFEQLS
ncbi:hypothetical protein EYB53_024750, partial [Candidatus Chloroploca sp. M-50]|nr:hypothetical protein [Candidatus Chloroploca mongolica]